MSWIDLRSDTVTRPTEGMRRAIAAAPVGDDVFEEDPTVRKLEEQMAERLGKESGLFVASGTMGNLVAFLTHAGRGDEVLLGDLSHTFLYEAGGSAALGGIHPRTVPNRPDGTLAVADLERAVRTENVHFPRTRLLCLENTQNRCGGAVLPPESLEDAAAFARRHRLSIHLDGARLFNAAVALGVPPASLAECADSVMVCLSKGLGAPVGSVLCGSRGFIAEARRARKIVGGGMRQVGILAAAGLYALDHHIARLAEDHEAARRLAEGIARIDGLFCPQSGPPTGAAWTNLVYVRLDRSAVEDPDVTAVILCSRLRDRGILALPSGTEPAEEIRLVTHLDICQEDIENTLTALRSAVRGT